MENKPVAERTELLHRGKVVKGMDFEKPTVLPFFPNSAFTMDSLAEVKEAYASKFTYIRTNNPDREALADVVSCLEGSEASLIVSSGMAAITTTLFTVLNPGDEVIWNSYAYGENFDVFEKLLPRFGIKTIKVDFKDIANIKKAMTANTKIVYTEVLANPVMMVSDIPAIAKLAHEGGAMLMVDNTFTSGISIKPITLGADIVINSMTKFMNGLSDAIGGSISTTADLIAKIRPVRMLLGTSGDPYMAFTMLRNFTTMDLRVRRQMDNAAKLAAMLEKHPAVRKVYHPSLESFDQHELACKLFRSNEEMSGMVTFVLPDDEEKVDAFAERLQIAKYAPTLGGVHTTYTLPLLSSHKLIPEEDKKFLGVTYGMIRVSTGIEDINDLIADFEQALEVFDK